MTGVSDMQPVAPILELVKLVPDAKAVGVIYNAGESNSVFLIKAERDDAAKLGYKLIEAPPATRPRCRRRRNRS